MNILGTSRPHRVRPPLRRVLAGLAALFCLTGGALAQTALTVDGEIAVDALLFPDGSLQTSAASGDLAPGNLLVVAQSGGHFSSVQAALDAIGTTLPAASAANPYLVQVAPGVYDERVTMEPWVHLRGSGETTTRITSTGDASDTVGTVIGADDSRLSRLTVESTGAAAFAIAVYNGSDMVLRKVTAVAYGGTDTSIGVVNAGTGDGRLVEVTAEASGNAKNYGVLNRNDAELDRVEATATGGTEARGVFNDGSGGGPIRPRLIDVRASASGASGENDGVFNDTSDTLMLRVAATGSGGDPNHAVHNDASAPLMSLVTALARGVGTFGNNVTNNAVHNVNSAPEIRNSLLEAPLSLFAANRAMQVDASSSVKLAHSQLQGVVNVESGGALTCFQVSDSAFAALACTTP